VITSQTLEITTIDMVDIMGLKMSMVIIIPFIYGLKRKETDEYGHHLYTIHILPEEKGNYTHVFNSDYTKVCRSIQETE
jgi:hypothetical protein